MEAERFAPAIPMRKGDPFLAASIISPGVKYRLYELPRAR
jgi:hypothetical protein